MSQAGRVEDFNRHFSRLEVMLRSPRYEVPLSNSPSEISESINMEKLAVALRDDEFEDIDIEYDADEMFDDEWFEDPND